MELSIIKQDVINELRNLRYYNEQEITRLVNSDTISHKERVNQIVYLVQNNVQLIESVRLMDLYFPAAKPQQQVTPITQSGTDADEPQQ